MVHGVISRAMNDISGPVSRPELEAAGPAGLSGLLPAARRHIGEIERARSALRQHPTEVSEILRLQRDKLYEQLIRRLGRPGVALRS